MQSDSNPVSQKPESFIRTTRRKQILDGAIETLAKVGYGGASLARIAKDLGISKGVISYHFESKDALMITVVEHGYQTLAEAVVPKILAEETVIAGIRTHLTELAKYALEHRSIVVALGEVITHQRGPDGRPHFGSQSNEALYQGLEQMYRSGQDSGELRDFDARVMAITQQAATDAMFAYWTNHPEYDLLAHADQLADLLIHAVQRPPTKRTKRAAQ